MDRPDALPEATLEPDNAYAEITVEVHRITSAGQISILARIRRRWGTSRVVVEDLGDRVVLRLLPDDPIAAARGILKGRVPDTDVVRARAREDERRAEERRLRR